MPAFPFPTSYCGEPPTPQTLVARWNLDPVLLAALTAVALAYAVGSRRAGVPTGRRLAFHAGWALTALALVSPLCALSVSLFSARVGQHMLLALLAAPLVAAGRPIHAAGRLFTPYTDSLERRTGAPLLAAAAFALAMWIWHAPDAYLATFRSPVVYWVMHVSAYASALWLWSALQSPRAALPAVLLASAASSVQMGFLGAAIMFAPTPLFAPHAATTADWGLSQLADQQLGGALMWAPGCAAFLAVTLAAMLAAMRRPPAGKAETSGEAAR